MITNAVFCCDYRSIWKVWAGKAVEGLSINVEMWKITMLREMQSVKDWLMSFRSNFESTSKILSEVFL